MKKTLAVGAAMLAALALTGCSADNQSADAKPSATVTPSASPTVAPAISPASPIASATKTIDPGQAWADDMMNLLLNGNSKSTLQDFNPETALPSIESWSQEPKGTLNISVSGSRWSKCDIDSIAFAFMDTAGWKNPALKKIVVTAKDSNHSYSLTHDEYDNYDSAIPKSCF